MVNMDEVRVLQTLERTARAIRRGDRAELVEAALKWEKFLGQQIKDLQADGTQLELGAKEAVNG